MRELDASLQQFGEFILKAQLVKEKAAPYWVDPRDVFMRDLDLPRGLERELVHDRNRDYTFNGSETRTLSTVGGFRVVAERDLH